MIHSLYIKHTKFSLLKSIQKDYFTIQISKYNLLYGQQLEWYDLAFLYLIYKGIALAFFLLGAYFDSCVEDLVFAS